MKIRIQERNSFFFSPYDNELWKRLADQTRNESHLSQVCSSFGLLVLNMITLWKLEGFCRYHTTSLSVMILYFHIDEIIISVLKII